MCEMRQRNYQRLQALNEKILVEDCGLIGPDFGYLQWMKRNTSSALAEQAGGISTAVDKFLKGAEGSVQQHMQAYYGTVEKATEETINELVESIPVNGRTDVNQKAYNAC
ncbi:hypothetical protein RvY_11291 [Ramazzottius varieornatus]|uniref:Uncharacterized protein n=1 Tax=Ramazzottius varieornatus TaxID=947166 RepID=A0A1D1VND7_RAMVA|nr:hypothetical protein RvY_11291 [Ramazzottius varieornatus]